MATDETGPGEKHSPAPPASSGAPAAESQLHQMRPHAAPWPDTTPPARSVRGLRESQLPKSAGIKPRTRTRTRSRAGRGVGETELQVGVGAAERDGEGVLACERARQLVQRHVVVGDARGDVHGGRVRRGGRGAREDRHPRDGGRGEEGVQDGGAEPTVRADERHGLDGHFGLWCWSVLCYVL
jgi:hypothetical protein